MQPWMHTSEIAAIKRHLHFWQTMLEYGAGGSTLTFPKYVRDYVAVEHDPAWHARVAPGLLSNTRLLLVPTIPGDDPYRDYVNIVHTLGMQFDRVLIDGRSRVACAQAVLPYLKAGSLVFFHDFWMTGRERYQAALQWYEVVEAVREGEQTLAVLQPRRQE